MMKRYQLYLEPHAVNIMDDVGRLTHISRSKQVRAIIERYVNLISMVFAERQQAPKEDYGFEHLAGFIRGNKRSKTDFAMRPDTDYIK